MKLKECSCGGEAEVGKNLPPDQKYWVACMECGRSTIICDSPDEAGKLWNQGNVKYGGDDEM